MGIEKMLDRVVVIDNVREEIEDLVKQLEASDISVDAPNYTDDYSTLPVFLRNRQLVFMDLMLDENQGNLTTNISRVIGILSHIIGPGFGPYGLVVWTKHTDSINELLRRFTSISNNSTSAHSALSVDDRNEEIRVESHLDNPPLFVIGIDKNQFKQLGVWDFSNLLPVLNNEIRASNSSYFFLRWLATTRQAAQDTVSGIFSLTRDYQTKEAEINHILYRLALNHTGIKHLYPGLTADSYKSFSDILHAKINALIGTETLPSFEGIQRAYDSEEELPVLSHLNSILLIDTDAIDPNEVVPGNVYKVLDTSIPVVVSQEERLVLFKKKDGGKKNEYDQYTDYECIPIAIELTPPCDFSNKKVLSRVIGGYIFNYSANQRSYNKVTVPDRCYMLPPLYLPGDNTIKCIVFDFRRLYSPTEDQLKDSSKYSVLFRATHSLFSDVLQKFSSHAARLGLNGLELDNKIWDQE